MQQTSDPKEKTKDENPERTPQEEKQMQTDPNITELKGLTDPDEKLEPTDNDNPFNE